MAAVIPHETPERLPPQTLVVTPARRANLLSEALTRLDRAA